MTSESWKSSRSTSETLTVVNYIWLTDTCFLTFENVISCLSNFDIKHCVQYRNRDLMPWFANRNLTDNILASSLGQISVKGAEGQERTVSLNRFQSEKTGSTGKPPIQTVPFSDLRHCNSTLSTLFIVWQRGDRTVTNLCTCARDDMRSLFCIQWRGIQRVYVGARTGPRKIE